MASRSDRWVPSDPRGRSAPSGRLAPSDRSSRSERSDQSRARRRCVARTRRGSGSGRGDGYEGVAGPMVWPSNDGTVNDSTVSPCIRNRHEVVPDRRGDRSPKTKDTPSTLVSGSLALRVAHPHAGRELRRVSAEPRVDVVLRGPGLACRRTIGETGRGTRAVEDDVLERVRDQVGVVRVQDLLGLGAPSSITLPLRFVGCTSGSAQMCTPCAASVAYALAISSGFTASTPSVMEHTGSRWLRMPSRCAMSTIFWGPSCAACAKTVLTECAMRPST